MDDPIQENQYRIDTSLRRNHLGPAHKPHTNHLVRQVDACPAIEKQPHHFDVPRPRRDVARRLTVLQRKGKAHNRVGEEKEGMQCNQPGR